MASGKTVLLVVWTTLICGCMLLVSAKPQSKSSDAGTSSPVTAVGQTKGFELKQGYSINIANTPDGYPYSSGWAYLGGRAGPGPTYLTDNTGFLMTRESENPSRDLHFTPIEPTDLWSGNKVDLVSSGLYVTAAAVALSSLYYTFSPLFTTAAKQTLSNLGQSNSSKDKEPSKESKKISSKSRRRRDVHDINQADADLTRLASIVLNAIASGECMQKSICQLGTQIGASPKGRLAFTLIDTLLPQSIHVNQYFVTMKKALKGDSQCDKFNCYHHRV